MATVNDLKGFVKFVAKELGLKTVPTIKFVGKSEDKFSAFGHTKGTDISVRITDRHPNDVMRTIAHELVHYYQNTTKKNIGSEDQANALAGRIMRKFNVAHPQIFKDKPFKANIVEDGIVGAANAMGGSSSVAGTGGIDTIDPKLFNNPMTRQNKPPRKLRDIIGRDSANEKRADRRIS